MTNQHHSLLDNPVRAALTSRQAHLAQAAGAALRFHPEVAPFGALASITPEGMSDLWQLAKPNAPVALLALAPLPPMAVAAPELGGTLQQMIATGAPPSEDDSDVVRLGANDVADMLALVEKTKPGPFGVRTIEMGNYIGIREQGRLIAMAGERMNIDGYTEISAVCVDDTQRGKGLGGRLMNLVRREILQRGDIPFLHVFEDNHHAIALYERLGFEVRQRFYRYRLAVE